MDITQSTQFFCQYMLPCGLCQKTNAVCPYSINNIQVTCNAASQNYTFSYASSRIIDDKV